MEHVCVEIVVNRVVGSGIRHLYRYCYTETSTEIVITRSVERLLFRGRCLPCLHLEGDTISLNIF